jgi:hypothetical protein
LIEINWQKINPEKVKEINIPEKNDCVSGFTFKDDNSINAIRNVIAKYFQEVKNGRPSLEDL